VRMTAIGSHQRGRHPQPEPWLKITLMRRRFKQNLFALHREVTIDKTSERD
jgi:hypothetical protein